MQTRLPKNARIQTTHQRQDQIRKNTTIPVQKMRTKNDKVTKT